MRALDIIIKKRDGYELSEEEIGFLIRGLVRDEIPDYQVSGFLMAVYFKGMTEKETGILTRVMRDSGEIIDLSGIAGPKIDKHSTGGVGDKISLVLAPIAASCGVIVPMMAGRGLGHTGGTIDKLESIPGYNTNLSPLEFRAVLRQGGYAVIGQSEKIAPADQVLYALRDVTGTVESIPLITASILSKKCAEGADGFVFDVKTGAGAFMKDIEAARALAHSLIRTSAELGKKASCLITDMDEPTGYAVGNLLEIREAAECLKGKGPADVMEIALCLSAMMLAAAGICSDFKQARTLCEEKIASGKAWEFFLRNVSLQGGDVSFFENDASWPAASIVVPLRVDASGVVQKIDAYKTGIAACILGAGRERKNGRIDPCAGIILRKKRGSKAEAGEVIALLYTNKHDCVKAASQLLHEAFDISNNEYNGKPSRIIDEIT